MLTMRCSPGTSISAGTMRQRFGVAVICADHKAADHGADKAGDERADTDQDCRAGYASARRAISPSAAERPLAAIAGAIRLQQRGKGFGREPKQQDDQPARIPDTVRSVASRRRAASASSVRPAQRSPMARCVATLTATSMRNSRASARKTRPSSAASVTPAIRGDHRPADAQVLCECFELPLDVRRPLVVLEEQPRRAHLQQPPFDVAGATTPA